jgi:Fic family protein
MDDDDLNALEKFIRAFPQSLKVYMSHPHLSEFRLHKAISLIYSSNKLEDTIPVGVSQMDTYKLLEGLFIGKMDYSDLQTKPWDADGKDGKRFPCQLFHHFAAYQYLCETETEDDKKLYQTPLTIDVILTAHKLLMDNATQRDISIVCGQFRDHAVSVDTYVYMRHEDLPQEVERIVQKFNAQIQSNSDPIITAADLFYDLITAHPFQDGNGRLCRLMAAYAFFAAGVPIPVPITTGHKKSRNHYMKAILRARRFGGDRKMLYTLFASSLDLAWSNLTQYCQT